MAQDRPGFPRIVVAVVAKEHDAPAQLSLESPRREDLGREEPAREEAARLLAERDDGLVAHVGRPAGLGVRGPRTACSDRLATMQMAQPITLYQREPRVSDAYEAITRAWAATAATKTALPATRRKKKATRKIPRMTP